jgi:hypothetical protein
MDRSSSGRSQKLRGKITAQTRSTNDLIAPISAATSKSAGVQILSAYAPECCISSESFPAPPDVPGITGLVAGNAFVRIFFNLVRSMPTITTERALPVLYYIIKTISITNPGEIIADVSGLTSPITVGNLTNGNSYRFTLFAVNVLGMSGGSTAQAGGSGPGVLSGPPTGSPSAPSAPSAPPAPSATAPPPPTNLRAVAGDTNVTISFEQASDGGSGITGYDYLLTTTLPSGTWTPVLNTSSPIELTGLTNGIVYYVQLRAINAIGTSIASETAVFTPATAGTTVIMPLIQARTAKWVAPIGISPVNYLVVGGGGGGGGAAGTGAGGGGGGGVVKEGSLTVTGGTSYTVTVGSGGTAGGGGNSGTFTNGRPDGIPQSNGGDGSLSMFGSIVANGGGKGFNSRESNETGQLHRGGAAQNGDTAPTGGSGSGIRDLARGPGGGGGAGGPGADGSPGNVITSFGGLGGNPTTSTIKGLTLPLLVGAGGNGGKVGDNNIAGIAGAPNTGTGGSGSGASSMGGNGAPGGAGGSGIVILKYTLP